MCIRRKHFSLEKIKKKEKAVGEGNISSSTSLQTNAARNPTVYMFTCNTVQSIGKTHCRRFAELFYKL